VYVYQGRSTEARAALVQAATLAQSEPNRDEWERMTVGILCNLGTVLYNLRDYRGAAQDLQQAISISDSSKYRDAGRLAILLTNYAQVLRKQKRKDDVRLIEGRLKGLLDDRVPSDGGYVVDVNSLKAHR
jgi:tetratricopeptide (TPR) repeat protein